MDETNSRVSVTGPRRQGMVGVNHRTLLCSAMATGLYQKRSLPTVKGTSDRMWTTLLGKQRWTPYC